MKAFRSPKTTLGDLDADAAATLIASAVDIALILDDTGVIRDVAISAAELAADLQGHERWVGKRWEETVTEDGRPKVGALIADAVSKREPRWRHLNHLLAHRADVPILYAAVQAGTPGRIVAFGRDLRPVSSLQRRLVDAQQSMERDYARIRHVETRYRMLFEMAPDAVFIVDGDGQKVLDSNPAARRMFGQATTRRSDWRISQLFTDDGARSVESLLDGLMASGRADDVLPDWPRTSARSSCRRRCSATTPGRRAWCASVRNMPTQTARSFPRSSRSC